MKTPRFALLLLIVVGASLGSWSATMGGDHLKKKDSQLQTALVVEVNLDKTVLREGDEFILQYSLTNQSDRDLRILPWGGEYTINWIQVYSSTTTEKMKSFPKVIYDLKMRPDLNDYKILKPGESFKRNFRGKLVEGSVFNPLTNLAEGGLHIKFEDSAISIIGSGDYLFVGTYTAPEEWRNYGSKQFGISDIWTGNVQSIPVKIVIE